MEIGISMFGDQHIDPQGNIQPTSQRLQELIEEIKLMDELGLDFFGIGEHPARLCRKHPGDHPGCGSNSH